MRYNITKLFSMAQMIKSCKLYKGYETGYTFCKLSHMLKIFLCACILWMFTPKTFCQKTPAEFGTTAFYCFQHNTLDSLFKMFPSLAEISMFYHSSIAVHDLAVGVLAEFFVRDVKCRLNHAFSVDYLANKATDSQTGTKRV